FAVFQILKVPFVTWSISLQREAEDWVKYLAENNKFGISKTNSGNLYMSAYRPREYCSEAVWWFHSQEKYYDFRNPHYVKAASNFTQMVWKNVKQIGAAWAFRKDYRLVVAIKYSPESNEDGNFEENVFPPIAETLGPEWARNPPEYARCPRENIPSQPPTNATTNASKPHVKGVARKTGSNLELFIVSVILAGLFS
ncbi:Golgi-associated plant pathogenesis-related protein 1-like, partial [Orbicella faveolata]|uniref:Golgi-associated plant pathogenesis-related protein 1-like n=1 Tax=Orbicella faveolata TaxID=48498 RepID=UPI0009E2C6FA